MGAEVLAGRGVHFRVWAPPAARVEVVLEAGPGSGGAVPLRPEEGGYFCGARRGRGGAGTRYRFRLDDDDTLYPDPASRFQPEGPHGPSEVVDPARVRVDRRGLARGAPLQGQVIYEMHVGTFTQEGTWAAAARELPELARTRHHLHRADAGRRVPRPLRLGLRRRRPVRARRASTAARRLPRASSTRRTRSASA